MANFDLLIPQKSQFDKMNATLERQNVLLAEMISAQAESVASLREIHEIVQRGDAPNVFAIGDQINVNWSDGTNSYVMPMDVTHFGNVTLEDGETVPGMFVQCHYTTPYGLQFDAAENTALVSGTDESVALEGLAYYAKDGDTYSRLTLSVGDTLPYSSHDALYHNAINDSTCNILKYGYNNWKQSAVRQHLNSRAATNAWWTSQHTGDVAPSALSTIRGFMAGFDDAFLDIIKPIKVQTASNTVTDGGATDITYDTFFLPSREQMWVEPQISGVEGDYWEYWKRRLATASPLASYVANAGTYTYAINAKTSAQYVWLRSANRGNSCHAWYLYPHSGGNVTSYTATNSFRLAPACAIC